MQKIVATILLLAIFAQTFNQGIYYIDYLVDKAEYAKNCINKALPAMGCEGKCQLMMKIQQMESKNQVPPEMKLAQKTDLISNRNFLGTQIYSIARKDQEFTILNSTGSPIDRPSFLFRPPTAARI